MFGIGGGELVFILFIVLMLFGADKVPEIARTMGKTMAQLRNATNDIKNEIHKGAEANGLDPKALDNLKGNITSEINKVNTNLLGDTSNVFSSEIKNVKDSLENETTTVVSSVKDVLEDLEGPIKRQG